MPRLREVAIARQIDEPRFPAVVVRAQGRSSSDCCSAISWLRCRAGAVSRNSGSLRVRRLRGQRREPCRSSTRRSMSPSRSNGRRVHGARKSRHSVSSHAARRSRSIGPSCRGRRGRRERLERLDRRSARRTPSGGSFELLLQPAAERFVEQPLGLGLGEHGEQRIDPRLDRALAQQLGAEPVDRADVRFFEARERLVERDRRTSTFSGVRARRVECLAQTQLQLAGRLLGEGDGDDAVDASRGRSRGCARSA